MHLSFRKWYTGIQLPGNKKTGITPIDYYNNYFNKTVDELKRNNLLDSTLLVIVSDHGPRNKPYNTQNYHIPLLLYSNDMPGKNRQPVFFTCRF